MLNEYYKAYPNVLDRQLHDLSKQLLKKSDGVTYFPKLVLMLKANFGRWKKMAELKMAVQAMDQSGYKTLLSSLAAQQTTAGSLLRFDDSQLNYNISVNCF